MIDAADDRARQRVSEKAWQQVILDAAQALGWTCYHTHDSRRSQPGYPDLCCVRDAKLLYIECKRPGGKLTPQQRIWLELLAAVPGVTAMVARPNDWDVVLQALGGTA